VSVYGSVENVSTVNLGEELVADVAAGALALPVVDVSTFSDNGGQLLLNGTLLEYAGVDETTDTVLLIDPAPAALTGDRAEIYPGSPDKTALVNLGDDGDSITVVVPHNFVPLLPDGFRDPGTEEAALVDERAPGQWAIVDLPATTAQVAGLHIAEGDVPADRLNIGVTTNLIQDPSFLSGLWPIDVADWLMDVEPSGTYAGQAFLRSMSTGAHPAISPYAGTADSQYVLLDWTNVDPGRMIRLAALVRGDTTAAAAPLGGATAVLIRMRIELAGPGLANRSTTAEIAEAWLGSSYDVTPGTWGNLEGFVTIPDGYTSLRVWAQVTNQQAGAVDFLQPEVQVIWDQMQSSNYDEGNTGYSLTPATAQMENLAVLHALSADQTSFGTSQVGGVDVGAKLAALPQGVLAYARSWGVSSANIAATETIGYELAGPPMLLGRMYRIACHGHLDGSVVGDVFDVRIRYTTDGTTPTTSSSALDGSLTRVNMGPGAASNAYHVDVDYYPGSDHDLTRFALTLVRVAGTGTANFYGLQVDRCFEWLIQDMGAAQVVVASGGGGILAQRSKSTGTPDPSPAVGTTKAFLATWVRSFNANGTMMAGDPQNAYQGQPSAAVGNRRSLVGFDYAAIQAALANGTITACKLVWTALESTPSGGFTASIGTHTYSAVPATWAAVNVTSNRVSHTASKAGQTYTTDLGVTVGNELKAGTTKGIEFGPGPSTSTTYAGAAYGSGSTYRPVLVITYTAQAS
jgi:hypothetical protein